MGRGKIPIKKIDNKSTREVTFSKRRAGLLKKAQELSILCDARVAVIVYTTTGREIAYASTSMPEILERYKQSIAEKKRIDSLEDPEEDDDLREEEADLKVKQLKLMPKDLKGMSLDDLRTLEQELNEGLLCIKERKEKILVEQLEQSRVVGEQIKMENETLRRQVEELQGFSSSISNPTPVSVVHQNSAAAAAADGSHISLQLALSPTGICGKRRTPDAEIPRVNPETQSLPVNEIQIGPQQQSYSQYPPALLEP